MKRTLTVGRYQLENLLRNGVPFLMWDLRSSRQGEVASELTRSAKPTQMATLLLDTQAATANLQHPIILLCDDELSSEKAASVLEDAGFINVYVVRGGVQGLLE